MTPQSLTGIGEINSGPGSRIAVGKRGTQRERLTFHIPLELELERFASQSGLVYARFSAEMAEPGDLPLETSRMATFPRWG